MAKFSMKVNLVLNVIAESLEEAEDLAVAYFENVTESLDSEDDSDIKMDSFAIKNIKEEEGSSFIDGEDSDDIVELMGEENYEDEY